MKYFKDSNSPEVVTSDTLTQLSIMNAVHLLELGLSDNPFQKIAMERGFDLFKGDKMVIPKGFADAHGIKKDTCKGVIISGLIDCSIVFFRIKPNRIYGERHNNKCLMSY